MLISRGGFGKSAPAPVLYTYFGITTGHAVDAMRCIGLSTTPPMETKWRYPTRSSSPFIESPTEQELLMCQPCLLILFDLDGTLVETTLEIAEFVNDTLRRFELPEVT